MWNWGSETKTETLNQLQARETPALPATGVSHGASASARARPGDFDLQSVVTESSCALPSWLMAHGN